MRKASVKDILRTVWNEKKRFFSIMMITVLGVTMMTGIEAGCRDLKLSADKFYDSQDLFDISIMSTLGLTEDDVLEIQAMEGIEKAEGTFTEIVHTKSGEVNKTAEMKIYRENGLNIPYVLEGRLPLAAEEIAVNETYLKETGKSIGDHLVIEEIMDEEEADDESSKEELEELCPIGTPVGFKPIYREMQNDCLAGKAFDDKACGACAIFGIDAVQKKDLAGDVYFLFSAFEETSMRGAAVAGFGIRPDYALVLDVTHAATPDTKEYALPEFGGGVAITASPVTDRRLTRMVIDLCRLGSIPYSMEVAEGSTGTNANVLGISAYGIPTVLCSLPLKSMHTSAEVLCMEDANALKRVVSAFIRSKDIGAVFRK